MTPMFCPLPNCAMQQIMQGDAVRRPLFFGRVFPKTDALDRMRGCSYIN